MNRQHLILEHLYSRPEASQRELSTATGISLGQTNLIVKRLCEEGLLRAEVISKRRIKYTLTQRGLAERARHSNERVLHILRDYKGIKRAVADLLNKLYSQGYREFVLDGERGEISEVIRDVFDSDFGGKASLTWGPSGGNGEQVVLDLNRRFSNAGKNVVNVLHEIIV